MTPRTSRRAAADLQAAETVRVYQRRIASRISRMLAALLAAEWLGAIILALVVAPLSFNGTVGKPHPHLIAALLFGPALVLAPAFLAWRHPGFTLTRHTIAAAQMLMSALLIDVTNGRLETHFHIFGSLAFLAFYRDWRVLITASLVTGLDHLFRGIYLPASVYGVYTSSPWRWLEHAWWVGFEDFFLIVSFRQVQREMWIVARREVRLTHGAHHDVLTGLPNRRLLQERFIQSQAQPDPQRAIFFLDLDRFKDVNDTLGHTVGDQLLAIVSRKISVLFGPEDTVARVGGDEFVIMTRYAPENPLADIERRALRILNIFIEPFEVGEHRLLLSASIGVSLAPDHGSDLASVQAAADLAMYDSKAKGRSRWSLYSPATLAKQRTRRDVETELAGALTRNELQVHFQPLLNRQENVTGFEALMRWKHPRLGYIPPCDFIPMAEKSGLIVQLGEWILQRACQHAAEWRRSGQSTIGISVNVSAVQFEHPHFFDTVENAIRLSGIEAKALTLELTETTLMRNIAQAGDHLKQLRELGVQVALDDFGTGYSSLQYLQALPADSIKLDNAFIARATAGDPRMLRSLVDLAHQNGLKVTAEGVETDAQSDMLRAIGCDSLQGYHYGKPMDASAAVAFLQTHSAPASQEVELVC